jgi:hypothetical protein
MCAYSRYDGCSTGARVYVGGAQVRLLSSEKGKRNKVAIKLRMNRNPVVGDKFSSRHGQKGVLSVRSPAHRTDAPMPVQLAHTCAHALRRACAHRHAQLYDRKLIRQRLLRPIGFVY